MRPRATAIVAWGIAVLCLGMVVASVPLLYLNRSAIYSFNSDFSTLFPAVTFAALGGLVAARRPANPIGWLMLSVALGTAAATLGLNIAVHAELSRASASGWVRWPTLVYNLNNVPIGALVLVFLLFPDGRSLSPRWRWATWLTILVSVAYLIGSAFDPAPVSLAPHLPAVGNPLGVRFLNGFRDSWAFLLLLVLFVVALVSLVLRVRRAEGDERQQLRWFVYAVGCSVGLLMIGVIASFASEAAGNAILDVAFSLGFALGVPAAAAVAILKYGLYEIDVVINKTIVYGLLAAFFTVVYVAMVVGIGTAIGSSHNPFLTLLAAAVIAVAFNPVRNRAKKLANRIAYGKRATPYEVLSEFAERMSATYSLEDVLPRTAQMLAEGTGAARADVWLRVGAHLVDEGTWPEAERLGDLPLSDGSSVEVPGASRTVEVRHQGELLGALSIHKPPGDTVSPVEHRLLSDVASQAGLVLRNVGLIEDLKASRQRIVAAQDQERRRIERDIHDGAQQQLVALAMKLNLAKSLATREPAKTEEMLGQLKRRRTRSRTCAISHGASTHRCWPTRDWLPLCRPRPGSPRYPRRSHPTASGVTRRIPRPPSTSARWRRSRTWPSTRRHLGPSCDCPAWTGIYRSPYRTTDWGSTRRPGAMERGCRACTIDWPRSAGSFG